MPPSDRRVALVRQSNGLAGAIQEAVDYCGIPDKIKSSTRVALKPNLTYPYYKPGVTTSPDMIRETVRILKQYTDHIAIVESDGGYGAWSAKVAFEGHDLYDIGREFGVEIVDLGDGEQERLAFPSRGKEQSFLFPSRLLHETDLFITMPVPKIHAMTGLTLAYKNQWGCIADPMRLRRHYLFNDAIYAINRALQPMVLSDGTWFLDKNGPMWGESVKMDLVIGATDAGAFDRYVSEFMGYSWRKVSHHRNAVAKGDMPARLEEIAYNVHPGEARTHTFTLDRTPRNYIALSAFKSRTVTWFGYESWFGRVVLHGILYAVCGQPDFKNKEAEAPSLDHAAK